jgi:hypothetical protein
MKGEAMKIGSLIASVAALLAAGCALVANHGLEPGRSTDADVRRALGEPAHEFVAANGSRQLVFPRGPHGMQTYMAFLSADGRLVRFEQSLKEENFRRISTGRTTSDEVLRLIGPPWRTIDFPNKGQVAWDYRFQDAWGYLAELSVMIDRQGRVAETVTVRFDKEQGDAK